MTFALTFILTRLDGPPRMPRRRPPSASPRAAEDLRVVRAAVNELYEQLEFTEPEIGVLFGVSWRTIHRWRHQQSAPHLRHLETAAVVHSLLGGLEARFPGDPAHWQQWLRQPTGLLGQRTPWEVIGAGGLRAVAQAAGGTFVPADELPPRRALSAAPR